MKCPYYKTGECDLRSCKHYEHPEHCYLFERTQKLNAENPERRVTPNSVINVILNAISKEESEVVWEALSLRK